MDIFEVFVSLRGLKDFTKKNIEKILGVELILKEVYYDGDRLYVADPKEGMFCHIEYDIRNFGSPKAAKRVGLDIRKKYQIPREEIWLRYGKGTFFDLGPQTFGKIAFQYFEPNQYYIFLYDLDSKKAESFDLWRIKDAGAGE